MTFKVPLHTGVTLAAILAANLVRKLVNMERSHSQEEKLFPEAASRTVSIAETLRIELAEKAAIAETLRIELAEKAAIAETLRIELAVRNKVLLLDEQRAKNSAERESRLKSKFLDIAAHELRTPVTAFSLLLQITERSLEKGKAVTSDVLARLLAQSDRITRLIVDLLDVSRLERGIVVLWNAPRKLESFSRS
jgi:signal transduction histidine kinase